MTTIVWDGKILAADTRATLRKNPQLENREHKCARCGEETHLVVDDSTKISTSFEKKEDKIPLFNEERVVAVATAGNTAVCNYVRKLIYDKQDLGQAFAHLRGLTPPSRAETTPSIGIVILTEKSLFLVEPTDKKLRVKKLARDKPHAFGSGEQAAKLALTLLKVDAVDAIRAVSLADDHTGGAINWCGDTIQTSKLHTEQEVDMKKFHAEVMKRKSIPVRELEV